MIENFVQAKTSNFQHAKDTFYDLIDLNLDDQEMDRIFSAVADPICSNQLYAVLSDPIEQRHSKHPKLEKYKFYHEYLYNDILKRHTSKSYLIVKKKSSDFPSHEIVLQ